MQRRRDRNRKRSKRRAIYCPIHQCYLHSVSPKLSSLALSQNGKSDSVMVMTKAIASVQEEWLEAFWCEECQENRWYHVKHKNFGNNCTHQAAIYEIAPIPFELEPQPIPHTYSQPKPSKTVSFSEQVFRSLPLNQ